MAGICGEVEMTLDALLFYTSDISHDIWSKEHYIQDDITIL